MKRLIVLLLVVGMASLAGAAYEFQGEGNSACLIGDGEFAAFFISVARDPVDIEFLYGGSLAALTDFTDFHEDLTDPINAAVGEVTNAIYFAEFADAVDPENNMPIGPVVCVTLIEGGSEALVSLHNPDDLSVMDSVVLTPEPMSLALLGLGGLLVRRRR